MASINLNGVWQQSRGGPGAYEYAKAARKAGTNLKDLKSELGPDFVKAYTRSKRGKGLGGGYETLFEDPAHHLYARPTHSSHLYLLPREELAHPKTRGMSKYKTVPYNAAFAAYAKSSKRTGRVRSDEAYIRDLRRKVKEIASRSAAFRSVAFRSARAGGRSLPPALSRRARAVRAGRVQRDSRGRFV